MDRLLRGRIVSVLVLLAASASLPAAALHYLGGGSGMTPIGYTEHFLLLR
jgi:hypothetical protein